VIPLRLSCFLVKLPKKLPSFSGDSKTARIKIEHGDNSAPLVKNFLSLDATAEIDEKTNKPTVWIARLKDKLGTRQLPTAELELHGAKAIRISNQGKGISFISGLINITRLHNCVAATGAMAKATLLARDYATKRRVFGDLLSEKILHLETLASLRTLYSATLHITFECILLQGRIETKETQNDIGKLHEDVLLLRLLTPVAKAYSAKIAVYVVNESMECIGGVGYLEKSGFPQLMRDSMVLPIWEGTTNVLAMDVIRVIRKHPEALDIYKKIVLKKINSALKDTDPWSKTLQDLISRVNDSLHEVLEVASDIKPNLSNQSPLVAIARDLTLMIAKVFCASCLIEHALWSKRPSDFLAAEILINQDIQVVCQSYTWNSQQE